MDKTRKQVILIGPPRAGKVMVAKLLNLHSDVFAFDYEMNFLWRHGNAQYAYDTLKPEMLKPSIAKYIRERFSREMKKHGARVLIDRTDHNVVRLDYVREVFPEATIIYMVRNPFASIASMILRRQEKRGLMPYLLKAKTIPIGDFLYYAAIYGKDIIETRLLGRGYKELWGMRTPDIETDSKGKSLSEKCTIMWRESVRAVMDYRRRNPGEVHVFVYEDLVKNPVREMGKMYALLGLSFDKETQAQVKKLVHPEALEKWKNTLSPANLSQIMPLLENLDEDLGYRVCLES